MKNTMIIVLLACTFCSCQTARVEWVSTTSGQRWITKEFNHSEPLEYYDAVIDPGQAEQTIEGFGACFNELGWTSLNLLSEPDKKEVFSELFGPGVGANFTVCRMPVAANDFSLNWYSYNETEGDFGMQNFSVANDRETLIPFIKTALNYNPDLKIWASPWSPPSWMKYNRHYASIPSRPDTDPRYRNDLDPAQEGREGTDMFIQDERYFRAYALYFSKFIQEYRNEGIRISAVMPQNEFNSAQVFPSCCWTARGLSTFIGSYLGPAMEELGVDLYFGTMERASEALVDTVLLDERSGRYIRGVGFQWAGKAALPGINRRYPGLKMLQTEQECGDGKNDWKGAMYSWDLMKHYLNHGVSVYEYWNTSLFRGGISRWGWAQNSLVVVDPETAAYNYTPEYYVLKHTSHFVLPGARKLKTGGPYDDLLAFRNSDGSVVVVAVNRSDEIKKLHLKVGDISLAPELPANSINTFKVSAL